MLSSLYLYNFAENRFAVGAAIGFDQPPAPAAAVTGMRFIAPDTVELSQAGLYRVDYAFIPAGVNTTLALFVNDIEIPGSRYTGVDAPVMIKGDAMFMVTRDMLPASMQLRNVSMVTEAILMGGGFANTVNANMLISDIQPLVDEI